jgi:hypothetical protein
MIINFLIKSNNWIYGNLSRRNLIVDILKLSKSQNLVKPDMMEVIIFEI